MKRSLIKTVIINRAVPGSGKTTISNCIIKHLKDIGIQVAVHSTDEFFITDDGCYNFQIDKLFDYHMKNLSDFIKSLELSIPVVICDNINIAPWQSKPYTDVARKHGYRVVYINFYPRELEKHIASQQVTLDKPDAHGVPVDVLVRFIEEFNTYNPLFDQVYPINPDIHKNFFWDTKTNTRKESNEPTSCFDTDDIINIMPDQYNEMKKNAGSMIFNIIAGKE